jgi:FkbM family methyltransferase
MKFGHALNCYKLVRKNSELSIADAVRLLIRYSTDKDTVCEVPGLARSYYFEKDFASLLFAHSAIVRIQEVVRRLPTLPHNALLVDVGANNGWFSASVAHTQRSIRPHLFEPNATLSTAIQKNMEVTDTPYNLSHEALSKEKSSASLFVPKANSQHGSLILENATYATRTDDVVREIPVRTNTLDSYLADHAIKEIDFLKVDIQGAELNFLLGAEGALKCTKMALVEISFLDGKLDETLTILHKEFPKHKIMAPVQYGADILFYR